MFLEPDEESWGSCKGFWWGKGRLGVGECGGEGWDLGDL